MRKKIDSFNPDVVHFHSSFAGMVRLTYFFKKSKYKVVYCSHGWSFTQKNMGKFKEKIYEYVERLAAKKTSNIINISKYEEEEAIIHHLPKRKMKLIYNSISEYKRIFNIKNPFQNNKKRLLFIGRFDESKGLKFLLKNVNFDDYNIQLVVIGESVLNDIKLHGSKSNVKFMGWIDNKYIDSYICESQAVIVPSLWEGFGLVALETMKNKKMVISSNAGGLPELVENDKNGIVFERGSVNSLKKAILRFSNMEEEKMKSMGEAGYTRYITKYNRNNLNNQLLDCYKE